MAPSYRELPPPPGLEAHVACVWTSHDRAGRVLPDACADIVFVAGRLIVAGPATRATDGPAARSPAGPAPRRPSRFGRSGPARAACRWRSCGGRAGRRLEDRVAAAAPTIDAALAALTRGVAERLPRPTEGDPLVRRAAVALVRDGASLPEAGRAVGLGERQLRRRFERAVGYGPATLVRVQHFLALAERQPGAALSRLAAEAGYADQAHLTRECGRLAGLTPAALLAAGAAPAGEKAAAVASRGGSALLAA